MKQNSFNYEQLIDCAKGDSFWRRQCTITNASNVNV